jgi:hypothetical protein
MKKHPARSGPRGLRRPLGALAVALAAGAGTFAAFPAVAQATAGHHATAATTKYAFSALNDQADPTFNQLLGINSQNVIAGYFGSGADAQHPNKGYQLSLPYQQANYANENFPGSAQTQVVGIDNKGNTAGFWVSGNGTNHGFVEWNGVFASFNDPKTPHMAGSVNQLLGINDKGIAVGFYNDAAGNSHAYQVNQATMVFTAIKIPGDVSTVATGINDNGDIAGFGTDAAGTTTSWLLHAGHLTTYQFPGGSDTQAFGVNDHDEIAGSYLDGAGVMHGFTLKAPLGPTSHWQAIDDTSSTAMPGTTLVNGVNDAGDLVGFYGDTSGNTDGMLAVPTTTSAHVTMMPMPEGKVTLGRDGSGQLTAQINTFGLTPGSAHAVVLQGSGGVLATFSTLTANGIGQANATLTSTYTGSIPSGSRVVLRNGPGTAHPVTVEPIAQTAPLSGTGPQTLTAVEVSPQGKSFGTPAGTATLSYNAGAQTLTITVNASGLTPGPHAAHVHIGSCQNQGPVAYMLMDLTANSAGNIVNETRTLTGVTTAIPINGWYLNLHQGTSKTILKNGTPTIAFRPLLCANV